MMSNGIKRNLDPDWPDAVITTGSLNLGFWARIKVCLKLLVVGRIEYRSKTPVNKPVKVKDGELSLYVPWPVFIENWLDRRRTAALAMVSLARQNLKPADVKLDPELKTLKALKVVGDDRGFRGKAVVEPAN